MDKALEYKNKILTEKEFTKRVMRSAFNGMHEEPVSYEDRTLVLSRELYTEEEAIKMFELFEETKDTKKNIEEDRVKFCTLQGWTEGPRWWLGQWGRNSKPVWVIKPY